MKHLPSGAGGTRIRTKRPRASIHGRKKPAVASGERADRVQIVRGTRGSAFANSRR
jgi:hypothetical protein